MQITEFNKQTALLFRDRMRDAISDVAAEFGISADVESIGLSNRQTMTLNLIANVGDDVNLEETQSGRAFLAYGPLNGFDRSDLGKTFRYNGKHLMIKGWRPGARKYNVLVEEVANRKEWCYPVPLVLTSIGK